MSTLLLSTWDIPSAKALAEAARDRDWEVVVSGETPGESFVDPVVYSTSDRALPIAEEHGLILLEPPLDFLAQLAPEFLRRTVEYAKFSDLTRLRRDCFLKPADPLNKSFDAGTYRTLEAIRGYEQIFWDTPVLLAEPVVWQAEFRCFIRERTVVAWSPYVRFGRPTWKAFNPKQAVPLPVQVQHFCQRFFDRCTLDLPSAFVMDVGVIEDRGWGVVEFNPAWCSGILGSDPRGVLTALERATRTQDSVEEADRPWFLQRTPEQLGV